MYDTSAAARTGQPRSLPRPLAAAPHSPGNADTADGRAAIIAPERYQSASTVATGLVTAPEDICTVRERLGWQRRAVRVLDDLLTLAIRDGLPPIGWTLSHAGARLVGHCYGRTGVDRRREFAAWRAALGATSRPVPGDVNSTTRLQAVVADYDGSATIVLQATIFADDDTEADR